MPLDKAIKNGNEHSIIVKPTINFGFVDPKGFEWRVESLTGQVEDPYNLSVGQHKLIVSKVDGNYELISKREIPFEIMKEDHTKVLEVEFRYKNKFEAIVNLKNPGKADVKIILWDVDTGKEIELKSENGTDNMVAHVPEGNYKVLVRDLELGYFATIEQDGSLYKIGRDQNHISFPRIKIIEEKLKDLTVKVNRNGYAGSLAVDLVRDDINHKKFKLEFSENETEKIIKLPKNISYKAYLLDAEGYGAKKQDIHLDFNEKHQEITLNLVQGEKAEKQPLDKEFLSYLVKQAKKLNELDYSYGWEDFKKELVKKLEKWALKC
ncbi:MAG: hypothetical protein ACTHWZ_07640 [Peptoniphilaceae bacterium]